MRPSGQLSHHFGFTGEGWVRSKNGTTKLVEPVTHEDLIARARMEAEERRCAEYYELMNSSWYRIADAYSSLFEARMSGTMKIIDAEWSEMIWYMISEHLNRVPRRTRLRWRLRRVMRERMGI
jgi:hypothetical protein